MNQKCKQLPAQCPLSCSLSSAQSAGQWEDFDMMKIQINPSNELQSVPANLTRHMMSKIEFQPDFRNPQMLSFPKMYNPMGSKTDGLVARQHFLSKNALKTAFWATRFSDHLTLERASTQSINQSTMAKFQWEV